MNRETKLELWACEKCHHVGLAETFKENSYGEDADVECPACGNCLTEEVSDDPLVQSLYQKLAALSALDAQGGGIALEGKVPAVWFWRDTRDRMRPNCAFYDPSESPQHREYLRDCMRLVPVTAQSPAAVQALREALESLLDPEDTFNSAINPGPERDALLAAYKELIK